LDGAWTDFSCQARGGINIGWIEVSEKGDGLSLDFHTLKGKTSNRMEIREEPIRHPPPAGYR